MKKFLPQPGLPALKKAYVVMACFIMAMAIGNSAYAQTTPRQPKATPRHIRPNFVKPPAAPNAATPAAVQASVVKHRPAAVKPASAKMVQALPRQRMAPAQLRKKLGISATVAPGLKAPARNVTYTIINTGSNTYGYDVFSNGKRVIHQPFIPGVAGRNVFRSKADAEKVALLVTGKMKNGQNLPSVTLAEIKTLNVAAN